MITKSQIKEIRKTDLFIKELGKNKIALNIPNLNSDKFEIVSATPVGKSFAMHKNVFGMGDYKLTHINTKLSFITLKRKIMKQFIEELTTTTWFEEFDKWMISFTEDKSLKHVPHIEEIRKLRAKYENKW